ncbi:EF-hand domain pair [Carpediemonas membranifera]|uniref:EF-hand domain pair n=1 Tax=Carpediemonas membranifera TaxID=201153 RepID=A0A8J6AW51_9EUKA|nr:EF-hand domain pair [Carpediemonas membranifera]|eukprot:KAG9396301.1 EF-hand domain pair [Carpediemonas membranifera]
MSDVQAKAPLAKAGLQRTYTDSQSADKMFARPRGLSGQQYSRSKLNELLFKFLSQDETLETVKELFEAAKKGGPASIVAMQNLSDSPMKKALPEMPPSSPKVRRDKPPISPTSTASPPATNHEKYEAIDPDGTPLPLSPGLSPPSLVTQLQSPGQTPIMSPRPIPEQIVLGSARLDELREEAASLPAIYDPATFRKPPMETTAELQMAEDVFAQFPQLSLEDTMNIPGGGSQVPVYAFRDLIMRGTCQLPGFFAPPVFRACTQSYKVTKDEFLAFYNSKLRNKDAAERFIEVLAPDGKGWLGFDDFIPPLEILLDSHPGLEFLKTTPEFQTKFVRTVICRIFFMADEFCTGRLEARHVRRAELVSAFKEVDQTEDVNSLLRFFSYEHFYVIYCKFWELDRDHDHLLSETDLAAYGNYSLSTRCVERIFQEVPRRFTSGVPGMMGFEDFVWFILAEEDKNQLPSQRYWFSIADRDGDGFTTSADFEYFFEEQRERLRRMGHEDITVSDARCQMQDMVGAGAGAARLSLSQIRDSGMPGNYYNVLFNLNKLMAFEQRDPYTLHYDAFAPEQTDWDRWARVEYDRLEALEEGR